MKLTQPDEKMAARIKATRPGMAHFAFTGPVGTTCRECEFWNPDVRSLRPGRVKRDAFGFLKNRRCRKYSMLKQGVTGAGVRPEQGSCRHYQRAAVVPPFQAGRKTDGVG